MMHNKPLIFLPVESTPRELDYKLNIARIMCNEGFDAIIGNPPFIRDELKYKNYKGIFLEKGCNPDPEYYRGIIKKGISLYCLSDEGAAEPAFSVTYKPAVDTLKQTETIFLWGEYQKKDLEKRNPDPLLSSKYLVSGYPGFEFSFPKYAQYNSFFRPKSLGSGYILVNTNFASLNGYSLEETLEACSAMSPETKASIEISYQREAKSFKQFLEWLEEIFVTFPKENFVIRPHPAERQDAYDLLTAKYSNVRVSSQGNANQAISGAKLVLHNDCTTALQSYLANIPVISLAGCDCDNLTSSWAVDFGATPESIEAAKTLIQQVLQHGHFHEDLKKIITEKANLVLSQRFCYIDSSTKNIIEHITDGTQKIFDGMKPYQVKNSRTLLQKIKLFIRRYLPLHYKIPVASRHMLAKFTKSDLLERLNFMNNLDDVSHDYMIKEIFPNTFYIRRYS